MSRLWRVLTGSLLLPFKALMKGSPWLRIAIFAIPLLLLLFFLQPLLNLAIRGCELFLQALNPFLATPSGRLVLLNLILAGTLLVAWLLLRGRVRRMLSGLLLRRHLEGVAAVVGGRLEEARERFLKVATTRRDMPSEYPELQQDARLKLARLALARGAVDEGLLWLARIPTKGLRKELLRSHVQLRAEAFLAQGGMLPEAIEMSLQEALESFPDDRKLLGLRRSVLHARGAAFAAAEVQEKVLRLVPEHKKAAEREALLSDLRKAADQALEKGDLETVRACARKARAAAPDSPLAGLLLGRLEELVGNPRAALKQWGRTRSHEALELMAGTLSRNKGLLSPRELLQLSPTEGTLLLVAELYSERGEHRKALRAVHHVARTLGPTPDVVATLGRVLSRSGDSAESARVCHEAVLRLLADRPPAR